MKIVWDEPKRLANIARHGMDFVDLDEVFFEGSVIVPAKMGRLNVVGRHHGGIISWCSLRSEPKASASSACDQRVEKNGD